MSMLRAQVDRLRKLADGIEERYGYPTAVTALREAADTIWELRGMVHRERAEVDRLREYAAKLETANLDVTARLTGYIGQYDPTDAYVAEVKSQNAKLRELARDMVDYGAGAGSGMAEWFADRMRELGVGA